MHNATFEVMTFSMFPQRTISLMSPSNFVKHHWLNMRGCQLWSTNCHNYYTALMHRAPCGLYQNALTGPHPTIHATIQIQSRLVLTRCSLYMSRDKKRADDMLHIRHARKHTPEGSTLESYWYWFIIEQRANVIMRPTCSIVSNKFVSVLLN